MTLDRVPWFGRHVENLGDVIIYPVLVAAGTIEYRSDDVIKMKFVKLWDLL